LSSRWRKMRLSTIMKVCGSPCFIATSTISASLSPLSTTRSHAVGGVTGRNCAGPLCPAAPCWRTLLDKVERVGRPYVSVPCAQRHTFGCTVPRNTAPLLDWERVLSSAARPQQTVKAACPHLSTIIFDRVCDMDADRPGGHGIEP
jgi:hypothetical protein